MQYIKVILSFCLLNVQKRYDRLHFLLHSLCATCFSIARVTHDSKRDKRRVLITRQLLNWSGLSFSTPSLMNYSHGLCARKAPLKKKRSRVV